MTSKIIKKSPVNLSIYFVLACFIILGIVVYCHTQIQGLELNDEPVYRITDDYILEYNNRSYETSLPVKLHEKTKSVKITRHFSSDELAGNYIAFYAYNSAINVYIDGEQVYNEPDIRDALGFARPSHWYFVKVPEHDFTLELDMHSQLNIKNLLTVRTGTKSAIIYSILYSHIFAVIVGFISIMCGFTLIAASIIIKAQLNIRLRWLGLISIVAGIWTICNSTVVQIFFSHGSMTSYVGYSCYFIFPPIVTGFLLTFESFNKESYINLMYWTQLVIAVIVFPLQICGFIIITNVLWVVHMEIISLFIASIVTYIRNRKNMAKEELDIYIGLILIFMFLTFDIMRYYSAKPASGRTKYSIFGLLILLAYFTYSILHVVKHNFIQTTRDNIYKELAFTDGMTKINNRSAFEIEMEKARHTNNARRYLLLADLNNLKNINDNYGHKYGDEAIINTANIMKESFSDIGKCYRIGGDEFCVITDNDDKDSLLKCLDNFLVAVSDIDKTTHYPYSVATGYEIIDENGIDNCFKIADARMYQNKKASKRSRIS